MKFFDSCKKLASNASKYYKENEEKILTATAMIASAAAVVTAIKVTPKAAEKLKELKKLKESKTKGQMAVEYTKALAPLYLPVVALEATSLACTKGLYNVTARKYAAAMSALIFTKTNFTEYKDKVKEIVGAKTEQKVKDALAEKKVSANPPEGSQLLTMDEEGELFYDDYTGRYFRATWQTITDAQLAVNSRVFSDDFCTINELYYALGIPGIKEGDDIGFISSDYINSDFRFDTSQAKIAPNGKPAIVLSYDISVNGGRTRPRYGDFG